VINPSVCLWVCPQASPNLWTNLHEILCADPVAVAPSSSGGVAIRYVLPVLWMTSCLAILGRRLLWRNVAAEPLCVRKNGVTRSTRSLVSINASFCQANKFIYSFIRSPTLFSVYCTQNRQSHIHNTYMYTIVARKHLTSNFQLSSLRHPRYHFCDVVSDV